MMDRIDWDKVGPYYSVDVIDGPYRSLHGLVVALGRDGVVVEFEGFNIPTHRPRRISWDDASIYCPLDRPEATTPAGPAASAARL